MKFNASSYPATVRLYLAGNLRAGDLNRTTFPDLSCFVCVIHLICNIAKDDYLVPGGFTLFIVDGEREACDWLVALGVVPGIPTQPALQLDLRNFAALLLLSSSPCVMTCCAVI